MTSSPETPDDPGAGQVYRHLLYSLSLPERAVRSASGVVGGTLRHSAALLVPQAFQSSKTYSVLIEQTLDFMVEDVGGVKPADGEKSESGKVENYVARKAVGNFVEMAGMATLHLSPMLVLAVVSDVAYGSQTYLHELSRELKEHGVIDADSTIDSAGDLLKAVGDASGTAASAFDTPPLSVDGLRETIEQTTAAVRSIDATEVVPEAEITRLWSEMRTIADEEHVGILEISTAATLHTIGKVALVGQGALSTVRIAGNMFDRHILDHYREALSDVHENGYYATLAETSGPYIAAVWENFSTDRETLTEGLLSGRLVGKAARWASRFLGTEPEDAKSEDAAVDQAEPAGDGDQAGTDSK